MIDEEQRQLIDELNLFKVAKMKEMKTKDDDIKRQMATLDSFKKTSKQLLDGGSNLDICRSAVGLLAEAELLLKSQTEANMSQQHDEVDITFTKATVPEIGGYEIRVIGLMHYQGTRHNKLHNATATEQMNLNEIYEKLTEDQNQSQKENAQLELDIKK